jgi:Cu/Ag efflux pump CusA
MSNQYAPPLLALAPVPLARAGNRLGHEIEHPMASVILGGLVISTGLNLGPMPVSRPVRGTQISPRQIACLTKI